MTSRSPETYRATAEAGWRWVLDQVRWDHGPWIPGSVTGAPEQAAAERFLNDYAATVTGPDARREAWTAFVQALLGSAEFLYLN